MSEIQDFALTQSSSQVHQELLRKCTHYAIYFLHLRHVAESTFNTAHVMNGWMAPGRLQAHCMYLRVVNTNTVGEGRGIITWLPVYPLQCCVKELLSGGSQ